MEECTTQFVISEIEANLRLDKALVAHYQGNYSRSYFEMLLEKGLILLNSFPAKKRVLTQVGDEIEVQFSFEPTVSLKAEDIPLSILFEDEHLLVIDKPAGLVVHPAVGNWTGTLVNALLFYCQSLPNIGQNLRPGIVHRLDKDTSGLILTAKTIEAHQKLVEMFAKRQIHKEYLAVCLGKPSALKVEAPIGRHPIHRKQMTVTETGKEATTLVDVVMTKNNFSLVKLTILTGRTHQIRVHLGHIHSPIIGDPIYGPVALNKKLGVERQLLHASRLRFLHPITGQEIEMTSNPPQEMADFISRHF